MLKIGQRGEDPMPSSARANRNARRASFALKYCCYSSYLEIDSRAEPLRSSQHLGVLSPGTFGLPESGAQPKIADAPRVNTDKAFVFCPYSVFIPWPILLANYPTS